MTTINRYRRAYELGQQDKANNSYQNWMTTCLGVAYDLGYEGKELNFNDVVKCYRAGSIPFGGVSFNYREQTSENGLSVLNVIGEGEVGSAVWFAERKVIEVEGIRLPYKGSDGETLILPLNIEQYDF